MSFSRSGFYKRQITTAVRELAFEILVQAEIVKFSNMCVVSNS